MGSLKFLQTLDMERERQDTNELINKVVIKSVGLLTRLLCLRFRGWIKTMPEGIGKLTSLEELEVHYGGKKEPWTRFVKELCGLRELRVLRLSIIPLSTDMREVQNDLVLQFLCNLQKLEILSLATHSSPISADTATWEATGFRLSRRLRLLSLTWISFSRFPSFCINSSRLPNLSHLSLNVDAMDEEDLRILGGLPQLSFLDLVVQSTVEMLCNNKRTDDDAFLFQKLRRCNIRFRGVRFLLDDSGSVSFCMRGVSASMPLGSEREDNVCKVAGVAVTPMPSVQKLYFDVYVQEFTKDGNHVDDCVSLAFEYFTSLQNVFVHVDCDDDSSAAEVEQVEAALRRAANVHPNRPTLEAVRIGKAYLKFLYYGDYEWHHRASTPAA